MHYTWCMSKNPKTASNLFERMQINWPSAATVQMETSVSIQRLARLLQDCARVSLTPLGLSLTEFEVLSALRSHPVPHQLTPSDLYNALLISSGGLTKVLKALELRGLINRPVSSTDGRSRPIQLSEAGRTLVEKAMQTVQQAEQPLLEGDTGALDGETSQLLRALLANAEQCTEG
jgi:DNA-binding MarR family transcriptional regulator